jgi:hypothetical protein
MVGSIEPTGSAPHVQIKPLLVLLLVALVLPVSGAFLLDRWLGMTPWLTLAAISICLPLATVLVVRSALRDMDRLIAVVAPESAPEAAPAAKPDH